MYESMRPAIKYCRLGSLNSEFTFSQFWKPEFKMKVLGQGRDGHTAQINWDRGNPLEPHTTVTMGITSIKPIFMGKATLRGGTSMI